MNVATIAGLLRERAQLRTHDGWTRGLTDVEAFSATASATDRFRGHYRALGRLPVAAWQVIDEGDRLRLLLAGAATVDASVTADSVQRALEAVGVRGIQVTVSLVDSIPRSASGKAPLIRRAQLATAGH